MNERSRRSGPEPDTSSTLHFSAVNAILAAVALVVIVLGYYLLAQGSVSAAPVLLVVGYVILLPLAIFL